MNKKSISVKTSLKKERAIAYLEELVKSLKANQVCIQQETEFVKLVPGETMELEVSAAQKKGKEKLSFELSWTTEVPELDSDLLVISSKEPKIAPKPEPAKAEPKAEAKSENKPADTAKKETPVKKPAGGAAKSTAAK